MTVNPNPNEPNYPYGGGTDNPGDDTSLPGHGVSTSAGRVDYDGLSLSGGAPRFPPIVPTLAQAGSDTQLGGLQAVPPSGAGFESGADYGDASSDTGGVYAPGGTVRVSEQDETAGETETTPDTSPSAFPEPNP